MEEPVFEDFEEKSENVSSRVRGLEKSTGLYC